MWKMTLSANARKENLLTKWQPQAFSRLPHASQPLLLIREKSLIYMPANEKTRTVLLEIIQVFCDVFCEIQINVIRECPVHDLMWRIKDNTILDTGLTMTPNILQ